MRRNDRPARLKKGRTNVKIGNTDDIGNYVSKLSQGTQSQRTQNARSTAGIAPYMSGQSSGDTVEISEQAYDSLSGDMAGHRMMPGHAQALSGLVEDGTLTSDQAAAVVSAIGSEDIDISEGINPLKAALDSLVSAGTLTSDQADSIAGALAPPEPPQDETDFNQYSGFDSLFDSGTTTDGTSSSTVQDMPPPPPPPMGLGRSMGPGGAGGTESEEETDEDDTVASVTSGAVSSVSALDDSDETTGLIKDIVNTLLDNGTTSKDSISSLLSLLNSLDADTLKSIYSTISGASSTAASRI
jgi:hypothetical protein